MPISPPAETPSIASIDRDIVAAEVALSVLSRGGSVFDPDRDSLNRTLSELLQVRHLCEHHHGGTILRLVARGTANPSG